MSLRHRSRRSPTLAASTIARSVRLQRKSLTFPEDDRNRTERKYLRFAGVGIQFALTILLLTLLGIWLDERFGTGVLLTVVFLLLGFAGATWSLIQQVLKPDKPDRKE
jgi:ATP synthase protein I